MDTLENAVVDKGIVATGSRTSYRTGLHQDLLTQIHRRHSESSIHTFCHHGTEAGVHESTNSIISTPLRQAITTGLDRNVTFTQMSMAVVGIHLNEESAQ